VFIEIEDLKTEPLHVRHLYGVKDLDFAHADAALDEPVSVDFVLDHKDKDLRLGGTLQTSVRYKCARCLRESSHRLATSFDLLYLPQPDSSVDQEVELKYEDMQIGFYDGIRFDVDLMVLEQIELAMPMKFICQEGCKGLCVNCGADLNESPCRCESSQIDSRLAVLREFRKKMDQ
jgi:DUF177 domain-containing protein